MKYDEDVAHLVAMGFDACGASAALFVGKATWSWRLLTGCHLTMTRTSRIHLDTHLIMEHEERRVIQFFPLEWWARAGFDKCNRVSSRLYMHDDEYSIPVCLSLTYEALELHGVRCEPATFAGQDCKA